MNRLMRLVASADIPGGTSGNLARPGHRLRADRRSVSTCQSASRNRMGLANTLVEFAQRYPNLLLELKNNTAYLYVLISKVLQRFHKRPILLAELATALPLTSLKSLAERRLPNPSSHRRFATTIPTQKRLSEPRKPKTLSKMGSCEVLGGWGCKVGHADSQWSCASNTNPKERPACPQTYCIASWS